MNEYNFNLLVVETLKEHPEWLASIIKSIQLGIEERLKDEVQSSTDIEIGFMSSLDENQDNSLITKGLMALRRFGKTEWQNKMIAKYNK